VITVSMGLATSCGGNDGSYVRGPGPTSFQHEQSDASTRTSDGSSNADDAGSVEKDAELETSSGGAGGVGGSVGGGTADGGSAGSSGAGDGG
jgi:hypothetical protein